MKRTLALLAAGGCMAIPAVALADDAPSADTSAVKACKQLRSEMGSGAFKAAFGTKRNRKNAFGKCVSKTSRGQDDDRESASKDCKAERAGDPAAFATKYGTNKNGRNALGKCVSKKSKESDEERTDTTVSASKQCKAERKDDAEAFTKEYGTNENGRNAFGKCVSRTAKALRDDNDPRDEADDTSASDTTDETSGTDDS